MFTCRRIRSGEIRLCASKAKYFRSEREAMRRVLEFNVISIIDLDLGNRSVTNDIENVLRKIEYYHQGSIAAFHIMYRDSEGIGMESTGTANVLRSLRCAKSKKDKRGRGF
jgi:hypothetical protein